MRCVTHWHILVHRPTLASKLIHQSLISFSMLDISWNNLPCFKRTERKAKCHTNLSPDYCNTLIVWSNKLGTNPYLYCHIHPHLSQTAAQIETKRRTGGVWGLWGHHERPGADGLVGSMRVARQVEVQVDCRWSRLRGRAVWWKKHQCCW